MNYFLKVLVSGRAARGALTLGTLGDFAVINNAGRDACGFEVVLVGIQSADVLGW
jgi:hypothetical protein